MICHPAFDLSHLADASAHRVEYDFSQYTTGPQLTPTNTGSGSAPVVGFTDADGPALKITLVADPGTVSLAGPTIRPSAVKGVIVDIEGLSYSATGGPLWGVGLYDSAVTSFVEMFRDSTGVALTSQIGSSANRAILKTAQGTGTPVRDARAGLFVDFTTGQSTAHVGFSKVQTTTSQPTANDLTFRIRAITNATMNNYSVYMRRVTVTVLR